MNQDLAVRESGDITGLVEEMAEGYSRDQIDLIKRTLLVLPKGMSPNEVTDMELALCFAQARERNLRPLAKQCYFIKWTKDSQLECYPSWDGLIKQAIDTDEYEGMEGPFFSADGVNWTEAWLEDKPPAAAKCLVYRKGHRVPTTGVALWKSSARFFTRWDKNLGRSVPTTDPLPMWATDPAGQLGKCAKRIAVRTAFPLEVDDPISPLQLKALHTLASLKGLGGPENRPERLAEASALVGRSVASFKDLRRTEASQVFEAWSEDVDPDIVDGEIDTAGEADGAEPREEEGDGVDHRLDDWQVPAPEATDAVGAGATGLGEVPMQPAPAAPLVTESLLDTVEDDDPELVKALRAQVLAVMRGLWSKDAKRWRPWTRIACNAIRPGGYERFPEGWTIAELTTLLDRMEKEEDVKP